jgi:hypothetical protein
MKTETIILKNLIQNESYTRKVLPYLTPELFQTRSEKLLYQEIHEYISKYNKNPNKEVLSVNFSNKDNLGEEEFTEIYELIEQVATPTLFIDGDQQKWGSEADQKWLLDTTETFAPFTMRFWNPSISWMESLRRTARG